MISFDCMFLSWSQHCVVVTGRVIDVSMISNFIRVNFNIIQYIASFLSPYRWFLLFLLREIKACSNSAMILKILSLNCWIYQDLFYYIFSSVVSAVILNRRWKTYRRSLCFFYIRVKSATLYQTRIHCVYVGKSLAVNLDTM